MADEIETICQVVKQYLQICESNGNNVVSNNIENSSLLRRLLSGKSPLELPPPYRFGFPAYELVENDEIQIQNLEFDQESIIIDGHSGYFWHDSEQKIISYPRLNLFFQLIEKEVCPEPSCVADDSDPKEFKYTVKILKKIINKT